MDKIKNILDMLAIGWLLAVFMGVCMILLKIFIDFMFLLPVLAIILSGIVFTILAFIWMEKRQYDD